MMAHVRISLGSNFTRLRIRLPDFRVATYQLVRCEMWVLVISFYNTVVERASDDNPLYILTDFPSIVRKSCSFQSGRSNTFLRQTINEL